MPAARACQRWDPCYRRRRSGSAGQWRLPRGLEHASHVLGRALWHALALTDASPRAPQVCSTSREDKRTGFTVPPQTTRDLLGHPRERERLGETGRGIFKSEGRGRGGRWRSKRKRCIQSQRAGLPQVMMVISIVLFQKQTELGSIYLEEGTDLGDTRRETQYEDIYTVLKRPVFTSHYLSQSALRSPPCPSLLSILEPCLVSTICDRPRPPLLKLCCLSMT